MGSQRAEHNLMAKEQQQPQMCVFFFSKKRRKQIMTVNHYSQLETIMICVHSSQKSQCYILGTNGHETPDQVSGRTLIQYTHQLALYCQLLEKSKGPAQ